MRPADPRIAVTLAAIALAGSLAGLPAAAQEAEPPAEVFELPPEQPDHATLVYPPFAHTLGIHRAQPIHLRIFLGDRTRFDDPRGLAAVKFAADDDPDASGDDYQLTLFGVNAGRGEIIYNSSMQTLAIYGRLGSGEGAFREPRGIAATPDGRVYVADAGNGRVVRLRWDHRARALRWVGEWPAGRPFDVATDARGQAWVVDRETDAVLRFADSTAGAGSGLLEPSPIEADRWPLPPDVDVPLSLAVGDSLDPWYHPSAYRLYLVDRDGARLRAYDAAGAVVAEVEATGDRGNEGRFLFVALDYYGNVYATDPVADVVHKFDPDLRPLAAFPGPDPAESLEEPRGIAIWRRFGQVFVAEREGARYFFVGVDFELSDPLEVRRTDEPETYAFRVFLTEAATIRVAFVDAAGDSLAVADAGAYPAGPQLVRWGAGSWTGAPAEGWRESAEAIVVEARPTYSSRRRFARVRAVDPVWVRP